MGKVKLRRQFGKTLDFRRYQFPMGKVKTFLYQRSKCYGIHCVSIPYGKGKVKKGDFYHDKNKYQFPMGKVKMRIKTEK